MSERDKTVLIVDYATGRSSALIDAYLSSPQVKQVLITARNDIAVQRHGQDRVVAFPEISPDNPEAVSSLYDLMTIDLTDVAQDASVRAGVANHARNKKHLVIGPGRMPGKLEWDKVYGRRFDQRNRVPIPLFSVHSSDSEAEKFLDTLPRETRLAIKASGLNSGAGVDLADDISEAKIAVRRIAGLNNEEGKFLIEERVGGPKSFEASGFFLGTNYEGIQRFELLGYAKDFKRLLDGNKGPNTGGMASLTYPGLVSEYWHQRFLEEGVEPTARGLEILNHPWRGVMYPGFLCDPEGKMWLIERNARWGDPEAQVLVPDLAASNDFFELSRIAAEGNGKMKAPVFEINHDGKARASLAGCAKGYPHRLQAEVAVGRKIEGLDEVIRRGEVNVYGAGVVYENGDYYVSGTGRLFHLGAEANDIKTAIERVSSAMEGIHIRGDSPLEDLFHYRKDIAA